jgi:hypothetical protein
MDWYLLFVGYFLFSSMLTALLMRDDRAKPYGEPSSMALLTIVFLFGPMFLVFFLLLRTIRPASGDPFDIVYSRLDDVHGKTIGLVRGEIALAGQSLGGIESSSLQGALSRMVALGYARQELVPICHRRKVLVYRKGFPPKKQTLKDKILEWLPNWQPDPTRA